MPKAAIETQDTIRKQAFTTIASPQTLRLRQTKVKVETPPKIRYLKAYQKARITSESGQELSIQNLEKRMVLHKFDHSQYEPQFLAEDNRAAIIAILSMAQDVKDHKRARDKK